MYNHNKAQQSKNRVHISWDILYVISHGHGWGVVTLLDDNVCIRMPTECLITAGFQPKLKARVLLPITNTWRNSPNDSEVTTMSFSLDIYGKKIMIV